MKKIITAVLLLNALSLWGQDAPELRELTDWRGKYTEDELEKAVFAGGCFWVSRLSSSSLRESWMSGLDMPVERRRRPITIRSEAGRQGMRNRWRSFLIPMQSATGLFWRFFFTVAHDPTQYNYQGPDHGTQYRSAVFYASPGQKREVQAMIRSLEKKKTYGDPIVTELAPLDTFYPAEEYHQDFMRLHPYYPYIVHWDRPKILHLQEAYPHLLAE